MKFQAKNAMQIFYSLALPMLVRCKIHHFDTEFIISNTKFTMVACPFLSPIYRNSIVFLR